MVGLWTDALLVRVTILVAASSVPVHWCPLQAFDCKSAKDSWSASLQWTTCSNLHIQINSNTYSNILIFYWYEVRSCQKTLLQNSSRPADINWPLHFMVQLPLLYCVHVLLCDLPNVYFFFCFLSNSFKGCLCNIYLIIHECMHVVSTLLHHTGVAQWLIPISNCFISNDNKDFYSILYFYMSLVVTCCFVN